VFLAELCPLYNALEGFIGREEDSASEPDLILHTSVTGSKATRHGHGRLFPLQGLSLPLSVEDLR